MFETSTLSLKRNILQVPVYNSPYGLIDWQLYQRSTPCWSVNSLANLGDGCADVWQQLVDNSAGVGAALCVAAVPVHPGVPGHWCTYECAAQVNLVILWSPFSSSNAHWLPALCSHAADMAAS